MKIKGKGREGTNKEKEKNGKERGKRKRNKKRGEKTKGKKEKERRGKKKWKMHKQQIMIFGFGESTFYRVCFPEPVAFCMRVGIRIHSWAGRKMFHIFYSGRMTVLANL